MTDKQIIIDGVDVSGCKHYKSRTCIADYCLTDMPFSEAKCELNPNCYYKQHKRAEQKLEKIKEICKNVMPTGIDEETDKFGDILEIIEE